MIKQSLMVNEGILEKKFKILRTSIMLGNIRNREETLREYEACAKDVDHVRVLAYEELLASKMYTTTSLEEEETRLKDLITLIEERIDERNEFIDDYIKVTSNFLDGLDKVSQEGELDQYRCRLRDVSEYLSNCREIGEINKRLRELRDELEEKYENKANNDIVNNKLEDELIDEFNKVITRDEYYRNLNYMDIDSELEKILVSANEKKDVMQTFVSSFEALKNAGITGAEREEYLSYVQDAKYDYYNEIEKKFILSMYKLVLDRDIDYDRLCYKRNTIEGILNERVNVREELEIDTYDEFAHFMELCQEQSNIIKSQKFNLEGIDKLILDISSCEERLERLELANSRDDITSLLEEFSVEKPEIEKITLPSEDLIQEEVITKNTLENKQEPNLVIRVSEPIKMNVRLASDTAKLVMKKVVIVLEPKKFGDKKDKIKEAELELAELRKQEEEKRRQKELEEVMAVSDAEDTLDKEEEKTDDLFVDLSSPIQVDDNGEVTPLFVETPVEGENSVLAEIKIEEPEEEKAIDLFSETDPFLDDNEFEVKIDEEKKETMVSNMPEIKNIGTVKPNNLIDQVEKVENENANINLPTMGLTDTGSEGVPIVSENYIN